MHYFILVIFLSGFVTTCPVGWIDAGGSYCYHVSEEHMNWGEAQEVILNQTEEIMNISVIVLLEFGSKFSRI